MLAASSANAAITCDPVTWSGGITEGFFTTNYNTLTGFPIGGSTSTAGAPGAGGNPAGFLEATFPSSFGPATELLVTDTNTLVGDFTDPVAQVFGLSFDFFASPGAGNALYFVSGAGSGSAWVSTFTSTASSWETHTVGFSGSGGAGWSQVGGLATGFEQALASVDLIGFLVTMPPSPGSSIAYGVDNWQYSKSMIPEPGEWAMIATVVLTVGMMAPRRRPTPCEAASPEGDDPSS